MFFHRVFLHLLYRNEIFENRYPNFIFDFRNPCGINVYLFSAMHHNNDGIKAKNTKLQIGMIRLAQLIISHSI